MCSEPTGSYCTTREAGRDISNIKGNKHQVSKQSTMGAATKSTVTESAREWLGEDNSCARKNNNWGGQLEGPISLLRESPGELVLDVQSAHGHHFVWAREDGLCAAFMGPHGLENTPAAISEETVEQLLNTCPGKIARPEETELRESAVSVL